MTSKQALTDEVLMQGISSGDTAAFSELYGRYKNKLHYYFYKMLGGDKEKAQDFLQDLFMKLVEKPDSFDSSRKFSTWIYSIAHNMCKNEYRKLEVRKIMERDDTSESQSKSSNEMSNDKWTDIQRFNFELQHQLDKLDEDKKTTFILRFKEGLSIKEISESMSCSEGTVKSRIFYTNKFLSSKLNHFRNI